MYQQVVPVLSTPPLPPHPRGTGLHPIIHPPLHRITEHRPYQSVCGHYPVPHSPYCHYHKCITSPNDPNLIKDNRFFHHTPPPCVSRWSPDRNPLFYPQENCPPFLPKVSKYIHIPKWPQSYLRQQVLSSYPPPSLCVQMVILHDI